MPKTKRPSWPYPFFVMYSVIAIFLSAAWSARQREGYKGYNNDDLIKYYNLLKEREHARSGNMTAKQAFEDANASYAINLIHIGIMFFLLLCIFFTVLNLDMFAPTSYDSSVYY